MKIALMKKKSLNLIEAEVPKFKSNEMLVKTAYASVASGDYRSLSMPAFLKPIFSNYKNFTTILGSELVGEVVKIGSDVKNFAVGDFMLGFTGGKLGCHAEYRAFSEDDCVVKLPKETSPKDAVTLPFGGISAYTLVQSFITKSPKKVLVYGASGSVGSSALQLLVQKNHLVDTVTSEGNKALMLSLGARHAFFYNDKNVANEKYDFVVDASGKMNKEMKDLFGVSNVKTVSIGRIFVKPNKLYLEELVSLLKAGRWTALCDKEFDFKECDKALTYVGSWKKKGSVILILNIVKNIP